MEAILITVLLLLLTAVHLVADRFPLLGVVGRDRWLSAAAGVSTVYVFTYLLPKLFHWTEDTDSVDVQLLLSLVFVGLTVFFAIERIGQITKGDESHTAIENLNHPMFWLHMIAFGCYNFVIGYTLVSGAIIEGRIPFTVAMALHLFANDEGLRRHHRTSYHRWGRWVLAGAILGGGVGAVVTTGSSFALPVSLAILAGGIMFNAIKEELPSDEKSSLLGFVGGAVLFLVLMWILP